MTDMIETGATWPLIERGQNGGGSQSDSDGVRNISEKEQYIRDVNMGRRDYQFYDGSSYKGQIPISSPSDIDYSKLEKLEDLEYFRFGRYIDNIPIYNGYKYIIGQGFTENNVKTQMPSITSGHLQAYFVGINYFEDQIEELGPTAAFLLYRSSISNLSTSLQEFYGYGMSTWCTEYNLAQTEAATLPWCDFRKTPVYTEMFPRMKRDLLSVFGSHLKKFKWWITVYENEEWKNVCLETYLALLSGYAFIDTLGSMNRIQDLQDNKIFKYIQYPTIRSLYKQPITPIEPSTITLLENHSIAHIQSKGTTYYPMMTADIKKDSYNSSLWYTNKVYESDHKSSIITPPYNKVNTFSGLLSMVCPLILLGP